MGGAAAIGLAGHDETVEVLDAPAALNKFLGEEIEDLRMGGSLSSAAEVVRVPGDGVTEVPEPDSIYYGSGS